MALYVELSRPNGNVERWEKLLPRLRLLNNTYPMKNKRCGTLEFQRSIENESASKELEIYNISRDTFIEYGVVFFGGYAATIYSKFASVKDKNKYKQKNIPDFDILAENPEEIALEVKNRLQRAGISNIKITHRDGIDEIISPHYEILVNNESIAFIYKPLSCHSYNLIHLDKKPLKIASIDTMLSLYLAFTFANKDYYDNDRILCMAEYLFNIQEKHRLANKGLLQRFSVNCYGTQQTLADIRNEKTKKYKDLSDMHDVNEFDKWFLRYYPETKTEIRTPNTHKYKSKTVKRKKRKNKKKKKQTLRKKK